MKKDIILYFGGFDLPDKNAAAQRVIANGKAFRELGYSVVFIGINHEIDYPDYEVHNNPQKYQGFDFYNRPYPKKIKEWVRYSKQIKIIKTFILKYFNRVSAVIFYNYPALPIIRIIPFCRTNSIKVISDCTEWYSHQITGIQGLVKFVDSELRMRLVNKTVDGVVAISSYLLNYYNEHVPTFYIPPLVDLEDPKWAIEAIIKNSNFTIIYAGSPGRKDRVDLLIDAVSQIKVPVLLKIIGITENEFHEQFSGSRNSIPSNIIFYGRLSHEKVITELKGSDYSCFFRDKNKMTQAGFSTKFVESISAGTPVITNRTSDISDYCSKLNGCILVEDISVSSIVLALERAYSNKRRIENHSIFDYRNYLSDFKEITELF